MDTTFKYVSKQRQTKAKKLRQKKDGIKEEERYLNYLIIEIKYGFCFLVCLYIPALKIMAGQQSLTAMKGFK